MLAIKNNLMAEIAARQLGKNYDALSTSVARLSSGLRINSASDDAAGMAVRELIRADIATLRQGSRNASDAISMLQTAEGALSVVDDMLIRMKELAEQAATESYSNDQRQIMDQEFSQLVNEIDRISENTSFNGLKLLDQTPETFDIHLGTPETLAINTRDMSASGLGIGGSKTTATLAAGVMVSDINSTLGVSAGVLTISFSGSDAQTNIAVSFTAGNMTLGEVADAINAKSRATTDEEYNAATIHYDESTKKYGIKLTGLWGSTENDVAVSFSVANGSLVTANWVETAGTGSKISIADSTSAVGALNTLGEAIQAKDVFRAQMGYLMNRLESAISVIDIQAENLLSAESRISDVDVATEMASMTKSQVLAQAGISMLAQANTMPQMALSLLQ